MPLSRVPSRVSNIQYRLKLIAFIGKLIIHLHTHFFFFFFLFHFIYHLAIIIHYLSPLSCKYLNYLFTCFSQVVHNTEAHIRIIELLLLHGNWGEKLPLFASAPQPPPRKVSRPQFPAIEQYSTLDEESGYGGSLNNCDRQMILDSKDPQSSK